MYLNFKKRTFFDNQFDEIEANDIYIQKITKMCKNSRHVGGAKG